MSLGTEVWPDHSKYEGQFVGGKKQGKGKFYWADGAIFVGDFVDNNIEGTGFSFNNTDL